jgi:hypothetical protein
MAKFDMKPLAVKLRRNGLSIGAIARELEISKSTASIWCRDIELSPSQRDLLTQNAIKAGHRGRMIGAEVNRQKRMRSIENAREWANTLLQDISNRDLLVAGVVLYWAEGGKGGRGRFDFANSDPSMIRFMVLWLEVIMNVSKSELMPRLAINEIHKPRINKVLKFWSTLVQVPKSAFGNPTFIKAKHKKIYENHDTYYGVLRLRIEKSSNIGYKMLSLVEILRSFPDCRGAGVAQVVRASHS